MSNEKRPLISIVMPLYNSAEYLKEAIDSILAQTVKDWEFIIVNEFGSDDGSREIVESYANNDSRFVFVQNTERLRIAASMKVGLKMARGKYIARMDADDISLPERFEKQVEFLEEHPDIVMCGVQVETFGTNAFDWKLECDEKKLSSNILFYSPSVHPTIMLRKSFLEKYNLEYNKDYTASEDYDFFSRICEYGKVANLNEILFRYRLMENNATYRNNDVGLVNYSEVMKRQFARMGLQFTEEQIKLLSPHYSLKGFAGREALAGLVELDLLLKKILIANERTHIYDRDALMNTLHKRMEEAYSSMSWACKDYDTKKAEWIYENSVFRREFFYKANRVVVEKNIAPVVSVLMPVYNSEKYIMDTIWNVLEQSYTDFEFLILNEFGSDDDSVFIAEMFDDPRIKIVQNETRLGLAKSLNLGIDMARGKYLARIDADDLADKDRFKIQVKFLEENPEYGVCGSWQHHIGLDTEWIHRTNENHGDIKAELLYNCDLCHSTLMLRKEVFVINKLYYDDTFAAEDYELWTRAIQVTKFKNLPQILGEYRVGDDNITAQKMDKLSRESGELVARQLKELLGIKVQQSHILFLSGWRNEFSLLSDKEREKELVSEQQLIRKIWNENKKQKVYEEKALLKALNKRWKNITGNWIEDSRIQSIDDLLTKNWYGGHEDYYESNCQPKKEKKLWMKRMAKKILGRPWRAFKQRTVAPVMQNVWDLDGHLKDTKRELEGKTWELNNRIDDASNQEREALNNLGEKVDLLNRRVEAQGISNQGIESLQKELFNRQIEKLDSITQVLQNNISDKFERCEQRRNKEEQRIIAKVDERVWKAELLLEDIINDRIVMYNKAFSLNRDKKKIILLGTPYHSNLGDYAQTYCILNILKEQFSEYDIETFEVKSKSDFDYSELFLAIRNRLTLDDIILVQSGMHLTDVYENEQNMLMQALKVFREYKVVILPQTMFYKDKKNQEESLRFINSFSNTMLYARESHTYEIAKQYIGVDKLAMCPDVVHSLIGRYQKFDYQREGILICKRKDDDDICVTHQQLEEEMVGINARIDWYDTELDLSSAELKMDTSGILEETIQRFAQYKLVITDRLHGTIFALIANTPVLTINLRSQKVQANYEWYQKNEEISEYVEKIDDFSELSSKVKKMLEKDYDYNLPAYFYETFYRDLRF